jgi:hypothetical protein
MSFRYPAGLITASSPVNANYPSGVWTPRQALPYLQNNVWGQDSFFDQTVLLLHGDGTNGAQNNTFLDSSSNNFTITRNGNTTQGTFTPFSLAAGEWSNYFDGTGDYLNTSSTLISTTATTFTIEAWIYMTANPATSSNIPSLCGDMEGANLNNYMSLGPLTNRTLGFQWFTGSTNITAIGNTVMDLHTWNHIAVVVNSSAISLYVNGVAQSITGATTITNRGGTTSKFTIGVNSTRTFTGYASNVRVTSTAVYTSNFTPSTTPLTAITNTSLLTCQSNRFVDNSTNNFAITINGDVRVTPFSPFQPLLAYSPGVTGGSGYFDGSGDYLTAPAGSAFAYGTGAFTLEAWVYPTVSGLDQAILTQTVSGTNYLQWGISTSNFPFFNFAVSGAGTAIVGSTAVTINAWNHIAVVREGTGTNQTKIYLNGTNVATGTCAQDFTNTTYVPTIGRYTHQAILHFNGYIADLRVVKGTAVYTSAFTPPTSPVTAVSGTSLLLNFTNAGILDNTAKNVLETVGNAQIDTAVVKYGTGAMEFDGSGDYLVIPRNNDLYLGSGNFTAECWVYPTASPNQAFIMGQWSGSTGSTTLSWVLNLSDDANRNLRFLLSTDGSGVLTNTISSSALTLNAWNHVALVRNGSVFTAYLNGTAATGGTYTITAGTALYNATNPITVGATSAGTQAFTGFIDDLRITKGIARYTANFVPPVARFPNQ